MVSSFDARVVCVVSLVLTTGLAVASGCGKSSSGTDKRRVLVTGFNDWKDLGDPPNVWRCRDNPSCRLLVGEPEAERPVSFDGELASRLQRERTDVDWQFATMPVTWGALESMNVREYDIVINLGLGVYDTHDKILVENGAYNLRRGKDASGVEREEVIDVTRGEGAAGNLPSTGRSAERILAVVGRTVGGYRVEQADAREQNSYLCNETHYLALRQLDAVGSGDRLGQVHFVHLPYAQDDDYATLAVGVAGVLGTLVGE